VRGTAVRRQLARLGAEPALQLTHVALRSAALRLAATEHVVWGFAFAEGIGLGRSRQARSGVAAAAVGVAHAELARGAAAARRLTDEHARRTGATRAATALRAVGAAHHTRLTVLAAFGPNGEPPAVP